MTEPVKRQPRWSDWIVDTLVVAAVWMGGTFALGLAVKITHNWFLRGWRLVP